MAWNIADLTEHIVDTVPDRTALIIADEPRTYAQLEERANRLAHHLQAQGIGPGDHVGIYGFNSHAFVETIFAAYKLRAVPVNVNYRYVEAELRYLFDNADLVALVHDAQFAPRIAAVRDALPMLRHLIAIDDGSGTDTSAYRVGRLRGRPRRREPRAATSASAPTTTSTSSTRAAPPACPRVLCGARKTCCACSADSSTSTPGYGSPTSGSSPRAPPTAPSDAGFAVVIAPLMHGAAQWGTINGLINGRTTVLTPKFDAHDVWRAVEKYKIPTLSITGDAMGRPLIEALDEGGYDASSLVAVASTAAVFSATVKAQFHERFPNLVIADAVGLDRDRVQRCAGDHEGRRGAAPACQP